MLFFAGFQIFCSQNLQRHVLDLYSNRLTGLGHFFPFRLEVCPVLPADVGYLQWFNSCRIALWDWKVGVPHWVASSAHNWWLVDTKSNAFWPRLDLSSNLLSELPESFWPSLAGFLKSCKVNKVKVILSHSCCLLRVLRFCEVLVICRSWWGHPGKIESYVQFGLWDIAFMSWSSISQTGWMSVTTNCGHLRS